MPSNEVCLISNKILPIGSVLNLELQLLQSIGSGKIVLNIE